MDPIILSHLSHQDIACIPAANCQRLTQLACWWLFGRLLEPKFCLSDGGSSLANLNMSFETPSSLQVLVEPGTIIFWLNRRRRYPHPHYSWLQLLPVTLTLNHDFVLHTSPNIGSRAVALNMNTFITTVTQKGQITLPASIRKHHHIKPKSRVKITSTKQGINVVLDDTPDLLELAGTLKPKKVYDAVKLREMMENHYHRA